MVGCNGGKRLLLLLMMLPLNYPTNRRQTLVVFSLEGRLGTLTTTLCSELTLLMRHQSVRQKLAGAMLLRLLLLPLAKW